MLLIITSNCSKKYDPNADVTDALFKLHSDYNPTNPISSLKWNSDISKEWEGKSVKVKCIIERTDTETLGGKQYGDCKRIDFIKNINTEANSRNDFNGEIEETGITIYGGDEVIKGLQKTKEYTFGCTVKKLLKKDERESSINKGMYVDGKFYIDLENCVLM